MKNVIKPPQSIVSANFPEYKKFIFLGGSIDMGQAENWQEKAEKHFEKSVQYVLLNPRRDDWDSSWTQEFENPQFSQQVNWELNALDKADVIIMYFAKDSKAPISLLELGLHASSGKVIVCCPDEFYRRGNVEIICEKYNIRLFNDFDELLHSIPCVVV